MRSSHQTTTAALLSALVCLKVGCATIRGEEGPVSANTSSIDAKGVAHVTRVVPVPTTVSPQAQAMLARSMSDSPDSATLAEARASIWKEQLRAGAQLMHTYPATLIDSTIAGVPVRIVQPLAAPAGNRRFVLINLHGGGFRVDSGSMTESIPIAALTKIKVVSVLYRLSPEYPFPAAVQDAVRVYSELLKDYAPNHICIYGTSAGAILTGEVAAQLVASGLPLPCALGIFSGSGDWTKPGDSQHIFGLYGLSGHLDAPDQPPDLSYTGSTDPRNPVLSPIFSDLTRMPSTLFMTSTRDFLLSNTVTLHRAFLRSGVDARLVVFEGLPHTFWGNPDLPESHEAYKMMASFFNERLRSSKGGSCDNQPRAGEEWSPRGRCALLTARSGILAETLLRRDLNWGAHVPPDGTESRNRSIGTQSVVDKSFPVTPMAAAVSDGRRLHLSYERNRISHDRTQNPLLWNPSCPCQLIERGRQHEPCADVILLGFGMDADARNSG